MRSIVGMVAVSTWCLIACQAMAAENADKKASLAKAEQIVKQVCVACHGTDGIGTAPTNPNLAGQSAQYIATQLEHFKAGIRSNPIMAGMTAPLTTADMSALGTYFSQQKPKDSVAKNVKLAVEGQKLYRGGRLAAGVPACAACHSPEGAGIAVQYPRLAGQSTDYTYDQLKRFKTGERGNNDKDLNGKVMMAVAAKLSDDDMRAVAEYVAGLR